jgi:Cys-tRNA(Pro) deacylase
LSPSRPLPPSAQRVADALAAHGVATTVIEYEVPARTSAEAARVLGCEAGRIAKSLVFRAASGRPVLVIASGAHRVDERKVAALLGEPVDKADAAFVREVTGYAIGGVPPLAHASAMAVFVDEGLLRYDYLFAAGGTANAMFRIASTDLVRVSRGTPADVALLAS